MQPASTFLIARHPELGTLWAAIDPHAHHAESAIGETRFAAYLKPFRSEDVASAALTAAGAQHFVPEQRSRGKHGDG